MSSMTHSIRPMKLTKHLVIACKAVHLRMAHTKCCSNEIVNGNLKIECVVFPSFNRVVVILEEATVSAIFRDCLTFANIKFGFVRFFNYSGEL